MNKRRIVQGYIYEDKGKEDKALKAESKGLYPLTKIRELFKSEFKINVSSQAIKNVIQYRKIFKTGLYGMHTRYYSWDEIRIKSDIIIEADKLLKQQAKEEKNK